MKKHSSQTNHDNALSNQRNNGEKADIVSKLVEAYNTNAFDGLGDLLAENATLVALGKTHANRKEVVRYYQDLAEANWQRGWLDTAQAAHDSTSENVVAILADDLVAIKEVMRIKLDPQGRLAAMDISPINAEKIDLDQEDLLDRDGLYRKALYPIMHEFEANGYRVGWMSTEASSDVSVGLTKEGKMTYLNLSVGMWPLGGPMPNQPTIDGQSQQADDETTERRWLRVCLKNQTDLLDRTWYRGRHDVMELNYHIDWGTRNFADIRMEDIPSEDLPLWN